MALNSPSISTRPWSSVAHLRKSRVWDPSGSSMCNRAVVVQADVPNL